jgi:putative aldouronate transport system permease protein
MAVTQGMAKKPATSRLKIFIKRFNKQKYIFILLIAGLVWYIIFKYYPLWFISKAFTNYGTVAKPVFTGLANFQRLFSSPHFWRAFKNTLILSFLNLLIYFPIPIIIALSINGLKNKYFKRTTQFLVYIPHFLSWVVVGGVFNMLLAPTGGLVNKVLLELGVISSPIYFMASPKWFRSVLVGTEVWKSAGYGAVIYIAAIAGIDRQLYEAAAIDGASHWKQTWHVTLPSIRNTIATVLLLTVARILQIFDQVLIMYNSAVIDVADVLRTYSYMEGLNRGNIGYATAIGLFTSIVSLLLIVVCNWFSKTVLDEEIL